MKSLLKKIKRKYEYIIVDCPPSLGLLTINALAASNAILIPIQCEYYALEGLGQLLNTIRLVQKHINPKLSIDIIIPETGLMNVSAYNLNGQHIETLYNGFASSNTLYDLVWDASKLSSGLYIIKVESIDFKYSRVVSLLK